MLPVSHNPARSLAQSVLCLRGAEARIFAEQFQSLAEQPAAVRVAGDGETFRQALCFPVMGAARGDMIQPVPGIAPHPIVELHSGHVIGLRLADFRHNAPFARSLPACPH